MLLNKYSFLLLYKSLYQDIQMKHILFDKTFADNDKHIIEQYTSNGNCLWHLKAYVLLNQK